MKLSQLVGCEKNFAEFEIKGITNDSRKVKKNYLFVNTNGEPKYDTDALNNGAKVVFSNNKNKNDNIIFCEKPEVVFAQASSNWFGCPSKKLKLIGVTGTNGKTSVTYMLKAILESAGKKVGLIGTNQNISNNRNIPSINTTPNAYYLNELMAEMVRDGCEYVVMEVSSHSLSLGHIYGMHFQVAMFTNLTGDHLDFHGDIESYFEAKSKLFSQCDICVVNIDDIYGQQLLKNNNCKYITYSVNGNADYTAKAVNVKADKTSYELLSESLIHIDVSTGGDFTVYNSLCALTCARALSLPYEYITKALAEFEGVKGRAEIVENTKDFTVIIDYAHTPDGLKNILKTFKRCAKERLIVVFGCGGDRDKSKRPLMGEIAAIYADYVIVTSDNPRSENPNLIIEDIIKGIPTGTFCGKIIEDRTEAIKFALSIAKKDDIIILAGKGHETYQIIGDKKIDFDERKIIKSFLQA